MFSVALIGADGAGKSTIAGMLKDSLPLPAKYLYMGTNVTSSNVNLPSSRLARFLLRKHKRYSSRQSPDKDTRGQTPKRKKRKRVRSLRAIIRILTYLTEEYYRQFISWSYQRQGYIVLYDRHFVYDYHSSIDKPDGQAEPMADRLHRWLLAHWYPKPHLTIFLDAPPEILFARKGEGTLAYLSGRRQAFLEQGKNTVNFVKIDASQPLEQVYEQAFNHILRFDDERGSKAVHSELKN